MITRYLTLFGIEKMKSNVLLIENLTKSFRFQDEPYKSIKQLFVDFIKGKKTKEKTFTVLKNINLKIQEGEIVGLIGLNGAGKSTLLKLIAGILYPDSGQIKVNGSVVPLIELGAGFHPEFSGFENIFLNGMVLGLSKKEVEERLQWIIDFSELKDFINRPLKCYSSGMQLRLGFSIAASIEANLFLVDESLAVGDYTFIQKCLARIRELQKKGCSFLIASHDLTTLETLAHRCIWLHKGEVKLEGEAQNVIRSYTSQPY